MFVFEKEQQIHSIGNIRVGGGLGEVPTALAGTIFYSGHKIVEDAEKGTFDKRAAESLVLKQDEMSKLTGNPCLVQIFSESTSAMKSQYSLKQSSLTRCDAIVRLFRLGAGSSSCLQRTISPS